ncbi:MAG: hypothetical protein ACD_4C00105G0001 [uncultured bacterium (gcode 4)]|uniref:Uncharacterized protein n=1 Tax=uncultured bacterium (gcode 4) TaxID=1234023 RepID=K2G9W5_9BACT|nr:MAG: hypothetical protein ACD_4C00105G0001 [uncultured bacterium (gcode 4)]
MNEIKSEILEFLEYSILLSEGSKKMIMSETLDSNDEAFVNWVLLKLKNENNHITNFLKDLIVNIKDRVSVQEIRQEMTMAFLRDMKIREKKSKTEEQDDTSSLIQIV